MRVTNFGISEIQHARPVLASFTSAGTFAVGAALPLVVVLLAPANTLAVSIVGTSLVFLAILGALASRVGGASPTLGALRVTFWGALAMALTYGVGTLFGALI
jgi:VIT1/CCC1 family predicted Fe2+/Mn2+ transporter